jgi:protein SCO1
MPSPSRSRSDASPRRALRVVLAAAALVGAAWAAAVLPEGVRPAATEGAGFIAGVFDPPRPAPELALPGSDGEQLSLARYRGKVVVVGFGFTSCPLVCPTTLAALAGARKKLGADAENMQVVYVTVDPKHDDAARLRDFLGRFDATFVGGTGTAEELAAVRESYGVAVGEDPGAGGFSHSTSTYLIDAEGNIRALMPYGHSADDYAHDVRLLLHGGELAAASRS